MQKNGLIIHGTTDDAEYFSNEYPSLSNSHWLPWLQKQMLMSGYLTQTPEMPNATYPDYELWRETLEQFPLNEESVLIGHSCGGGFLLRYFSENDVPVKRIVLVAPWLDPKQEKDETFFTFKINNTLPAKTDLHMVYSDDDMESIGITVEMIKKAIPNIQCHEFKGYGHFCFSDMNTEEFPELRDIVLA